MASDDPIGQISPFVDTPGLEISGETAKLTGIIALLNIVLRLIFIFAGIWALLNIIIAGISFISAGGDAKKVASAWARIWQSLLGLVIIVSSFLLAAVIGILLFGDPTAILAPKLSR